jgi:hypothetical protein
MNAASRHSRRPLIVVGRIYMLLGMIGNTVYYETKFGLTLDQLSLEMKIASR